MVAAHIPPPDSRELLPPLLACLTTATASKQPPPALLALLSPILRQRVQLLASDNWLSLLCWDSRVAAKLPQIVDHIHVEPHPASGEIEVEAPDQILYRRSDPETLHARLILGEYGIVPTYLWCTGGDQGDRWDLAELRGLEDADDGTEWFSTLTQANEVGLRRKSFNAHGITFHTAAPSHPEPALEDDEDEEDEEDDGAYWAAYDRSPGRTPVKRSPMPTANNRTQVGPTNSELEYFERYASEVQPALDPHDPDEEGAAPGESTLNGNALDITTEPQAETVHVNGASSFSPRPYSTNTTNGERRDSPLDDKPEYIESIDDRYYDYNTLNHPRPASSASLNSIERLEREAESHSQADLAIKQHISTSLKSLFRLARGAGIEMEEFEEMVKRELEVLPLLEQAHYS